MGLADVVDAADSDRRPAIGPVAPAAAPRSSERVRSPSDVPVRLWRPAQPG